MKIASLVAGHHKDACSAYKNGTIRGVAVLIYSPTKKTFFSSGMGLDHMNNHQTMEANPNRLFTHQILHDIIRFHFTERAAAQYKSHDNPMHKVFGGMPPL